MTAKTVGNNCQHQQGEDTHCSCDHHKKTEEFMPAPLEVANLVERFRRNLKGRQMLQPQIEITDKQIDALVYELYGLTEEEIRIVEGS
jgi:hypothetical protein